ncbi:MULTISPECIES: hypothetical protein [unclassified Pantoea]|uniref:glycine-rich domain-containing protein n=1 Tax=unclassified Pantoea TaxID=2630326 RepID=UPI0012324CA1|nr:MULTISPECIES: hypothetical protein [unclassified Pantoea]KAA5974847.1 hypothetical protein F3I51_02860 [Pantoea sp. M_6]KAA5979202.1 hypothetical protein F3I52_04425 [Pantoea sp. M_8]KAA5992024.1 hypothetical protein F3I47_09190 [Pantoea sp. M_10]
MSSAANPENTTSALTGWVPSGFYGTTAITGLSGSSVTLTTLQAGRDRITLAGTLTSNINLIVPAWVKRWEIVNNCTGSFSVTVKTPTGSGVSVAAGISAFVYGDGTNINQAASPGSLINVQVFTSSGTYTPTSGTKKIIVEVLGAGGGGGSSSAANTSANGLGTGGGGGGYAKSYLTSVPASQSVTVGVGGAPASNGGASSFGSIVSNGGVAGANNLNATYQSGVTQQRGGAGGTASGGNLINARGGTALQALWTSVGNCLSGSGGSSHFAGTTTPVGGAAGAGDSGTLGNGGSGANSNATTSVLAGGSGGNGIVIVWEYA